MTSKLNYEIPFGYVIYDNGKQVCSDVCSVTFKEKDIKRYADIIQANGGHPVELVDLGDITDTICGEIFLNVVNDVFPGKENFDDIMMEVQSKMTDELKEAVEQFICTRSATVSYYAMTESGEISGSIRADISKKSFASMVSAVMCVDRGDAKSDFGFLKKSYPTAYQEILSKVSSSAKEECRRIYDTEVEIVLREFPLEVYDYV